MEMNFCPVAGCNPSLNGGPNLPVVYHFLPRDPQIGITNNGFNDYRSLVEKSLKGSTKIEFANAFFEGPRATIQKFNTALQAGAAGISFIGDSASFSLTPGGPSQPYGLQFFSEILATPELPPTATWPGYGITRETITTNAKVFFIAACYYDATMRRWLTPPASNSGQALVVPKFNTPTFLGAASYAWTRMLLDLGNGLPVSNAVEDGNTYVNSMRKIGSYTTPQWKPFGDQNAKFKVSN